MKAINYYYCCFCHRSKRTRKNLLSCPYCGEEYRETAFEIQDLASSLPKSPPVKIPLVKMFDDGQDEIRIGRRQADADVVIQLVTLAPVHVSFIRDNGAVEIHDVQDEYPTYVNDILLKQNHELCNGDRILLGGITYLFKSGCLVLQKTAIGASVHFKKLSFGYVSGEGKFPLINSFNEVIQGGGVCSVSR